MFFFKDELPQALHIEAIILESSVWMLAESMGKSFPRVFSLFYTVVFPGPTDHAQLIKKVAARFKKVGLQPPEFGLHSPHTFTVEPDEPSVELNYKALRCLQKLFRPQIPYTALVHEYDSSSEWNIRLSVLGGPLPQADMTNIELALVASGARIIGTQQSDVGTNIFGVALPLRNNRKRRGWLHNLPQSCGIHASIQT
ncbi:MAG TPA: hypothetical protein VFO38_03860 [Candidatus Saccharimonadales bacterium]|nr:hypothetical protein [Candidatus Saccharimonadales bacterium]